MFKRQAAALSAHEELVQEFLSQGSQQTFYSGRPDFVVLRWENGSEGTPPEVIIGEVKYTHASSTFSKGLRELLDYMHFARHADDYLFEQPLENDSLFGVLCTDGVVTETNTVDQVHHWDTESLKRVFEDPI